MRLLYYIHLGYAKKLLYLWGSNRGPSDCESCTLPLDQRVKFAIFSCWILPQERFKNQKSKLSRQHQLCLTFLFESATNTMWIIYGPIFIIRSSVIAAVIWIPLLNEYLFVPMLILQAWLFIPLCVCVCVRETERERVRACSCFYWGSFQKWFHREAKQFLVKSPMVCLMPWLLRFSQYTLSTQNNPTVHCNNVNSKFAQIFGDYYNDILVLVNLC